MAAPLMYKKRNDLFMSKQQFKLHSMSQIIIEITKSKCMTLDIVSYQPPRGNSEANIDKEWLFMNEKLIRNMLGSP